MADLYRSSSPSVPSEPEEIAAFFNQFLHSSSSASPSSFARFGAQYDQSLPSSLPHDAQSGAVTAEDSFRIGGSTRWTESASRVREGNSGTSVSVADPSPSSGFDISDPGICFGTNVKDATENTISSSGDFSCDSEKRSEASDTVRSRTSSKRSRAAEVHNLSEKRRRSRINERMKALQKLIPNSNKTDKASMLDEAIEYLKQLQLQVQMLSMRNGLSLYPVCLPGVLNPMQLHPTGMVYHEANGLLNPRPGTGLFSTTDESSLQPAMNFPNQCAYSNQPITLLPTETPFGFEPSTHANYESFNLTTSSEKEIYKDDKPQMRLDPNQTQNNSSAVS